MLINLLMPLSFRTKRKIYTLNSILQAGYRFLPLVEIVKVRQYQDHLHIHASAYLHIKDTSEIGYPRIIYMAVFDGVKTFVGQFTAYFHGHEGGIAKNIGYGCVGSIAACGYFNHTV